MLDIFDAEQRPMESLSSISLRLSVRLSLSFFKIGSLVFSDIVHYDSWWPSI